MLRLRHRLVFEQLETRQAPAVLISEVMYNPDSPQSSPNRVEWVELYNNGPAAETLTNARLTDTGEGGNMGSTDPFTATIPAQGTVVLFPASISLADFRAAWGATVSGVAVS